MSKCYVPVIVLRGILRGDMTYEQGEKIREQYLSHLCDYKLWHDEKNINKKLFAIDFDGVSLSPSFVQGFLCYFLKYTTPENLLDKIEFINATKVKKAVINVEIEEYMKNKNNISGGASIEYPNTKIMLLDKDKPVVKIVTKPEYWDGYILMGIVCYN